MISFKVQCISIVNRKANSSIEQQKCEDHEKRGRLLISEMETIRFPSEIKVYLLIQYHQIRVFKSKRVKTKLIVKLAEL